MEISRLFDCPGSHHRMTKLCIVSPYGVEFPMVNYYPCLDWKFECFLKKGQYNFTHSELLSKISMNQEAGTPNYQIQINSMSNE